MEKYKVSIQTRKKRQKLTAEVFTPPSLVGNLLDKISELCRESWEENKLFLDPTCGNGNFLVDILRRKLASGHNPLIALQTIYGVDIMPDNIKECRLRLLQEASERNPIGTDHITAVLTNIVCKDSLTYDFSFNEQPTDNQILEYLLLTEFQRLKI